MTAKNFAKHYAALLEVTLDKEGFDKFEEELGNIIGYYARNICKNQREICAEKIVMDAELQYGSPVPDCWSIDSILNAPDPEI